MDNKCWICGKQEPMMFTCRHCGKTFCSDHRLPERHACEDLDRNAGYSSGTSGTSGNYNRSNTGGQAYGPEMDDVIKNMMKDAARTAAKGAATGAVHRTRSSISTSPSMAIIFICIISFFLELIPGYVDFFQLVPNTIFLKPWTLITHMFLHASFGHIFFNMLVLFFFGRELERRIGKDMFLYVYFISGVVAALGYALTSSVSYHPMVGASGAIMGVFATLAILAPDMQVYVYFIPMKIKYALLLFVLLDFTLIGAPDMIAHTAHLSGVLVGLYMGIRIRNNRKQRRRAEYDPRRW
ncbi:rhomboid family intramembrane serine protease [Methanococcoides sp. NM1]|uniref:rhomboid family intramembrane serine protease n=1 Tax=Methanococcoides sp. NM1 TaxID=1201013 RepID=UPI00108306A4|nr:rhomboid family intramembrane serine protease [Methanococcoides sp. NM1]